MLMLKCGISLVSYFYLLLTSSVKLPSKNVRSFCQLSNEILFEKKNDNICQPMHRMCTKLRRRRMRNDRRRNS